MLLLFETPAGYSLFKVKDEKRLKDAEVRARERARVNARAGAGSGPEGWAHRGIGGGRETDEWGAGRGSRRARAVSWGGR